MFLLHTRVIYTPSKAGSFLAYIFHLSGNIHFMTYFNAAEITTMVTYTYV